MKRTECISLNVCWTSKVYIQAQQAAPQPDGFGYYEQVCGITVAGHLTTHLG